MHELLKCTAEGLTLLGMFSLCLAMLCLSSYMVYKEVLVDPDNSFKTRLVFCALGYFGSILSLGPILGILAYITS